jgi:hypothetical protein
MDRAAPLNSRKAAPVKTGTVARRGARVHQEYRQLPVLRCQTRQTRRSAAGRGFLRCDCGLRHKQPAEPVREGLSKARNEFRHNDTRSIPALRVQCRYCAPARFRWLFFGDQQDTQSRNRSDERKMHETRTRTWNAGSLDAAGPFQPERSDAKFPANDFATGSHDLGKDSRDSQWRMTRMIGPADDSSSPWERLRSLPDANPKGHLKHGGFQARFAGDADRLHFKSKEPWMSMEEVRVSGTFCQAEWAH